MGLIKRLVQNGIGVVGRHLINLADVPTGGIASKLLNKTVDFAKDNSGLIGKTIGRLGRNILNQSIRNKLSEAATNAIQLLPSGKVKDTLKSINEAAQDRYHDDEMHGPIRRESVSDTGHRHRALAMNDDAELRRERRRERRRRRASEFGGI